MTFMNAGVKENKLGENWGSEKTDLAEFRLAEEE